MAESAVLCSILSLDLFCVDGSAKSMNLLCILYVKQLFLSQAHERELAQAFCVKIPAAFSANPAL